MANNPSALKAHRQNIKRREHNRQLRTRLRGALKSMRASIAGNDATTLTEAMRTTVSLIDRMAGKGIIHRNAAARYKSRLVKRLVKGTKGAAA